MWQQVDTAMQEGNGDEDELSEGDSDLSGTGITSIQTGNGGAGLGSVGTGSHAQVRSKLVPTHAHAASPHE